MDGIKFKDLGYTAIPGTFTVDPGDHTGWARWGVTPKPLTGSFHLEAKLKRKLNRQQQIFELGEMFADTIRTLQIDQNIRVNSVVIEEVSLWAGSLNSMTSATRGNLFKLSMLIGVYICKCGEMKLPVKLVKPNDWKGQLPDEAVARRINTMLGVHYPNPHIYSAVGIGLNEMGIFKNMGICK